MNLPWFSLRIFGFELVNHLYLASSASVDFDDIVLTTTEPPPAPSDQSEKEIGSEREGEVTATPSMPPSSH